MMHNTQAEHYIMCSQGEEQSKARRKARPGAGRRDEYRGLSIKQRYQDKCPIPYTCIAMATCALGVRHDIR